MTNDIVNNIIHCTSHYHVFYFKKKNDVFIIAP
jgi:hypothetical protein